MNSLLVAALVTVSLVSDIHQDADGLFSKVAAEMAQVRFDLLKRDTGVDVLVVVKARASDRSGFGSVRTQRDKDRFFENWLVDLAAEHRSRGVVVLFCKNPGRIQLDAEARVKQTLPPGALDRARDAALVELKAKRPDMALGRLSEALDREIRKAHDGPVVEVAGVEPPVLPRTGESPEPVPQSSGGGYFLVGIVVMIAALVLLILCMNQVRTDRRRTEHMSGLLERSSSSSPAPKSSTLGVTQPDMSPPDQGPSGGGLIAGLVVGQMMQSPPSPAPPPADSSPSRSSGDGGSLLSSGFDSSSFDSGSSYSGGSGSDFGGSSDGGGSFDGGSGGDV